MEKRKQQLSALQKPTGNDGSTSAGSATAIIEQKKSSTNTQRLFK